MVTSRAIRNDVWMRWRGRWSAWSWRARLGWGLLGWAVVVLCVALPAWAIAAGDLNEVAGWANILALPVTVMGLLLVLVDRERTRAPRPAVARATRPWMAPPLDRMVERPELGGQLVAALTGPSAVEVGLTTTLQGAGGFGKTRLATWACYQADIERRFPGGLLWVTVGQEVRDADLAERINDLVVVLGGARPAISDPDAAGAELGRLLDDCEPVLLVVDDVWDAVQLRPFRFGGRRCTRLVTSRIPDLLPDGPQVRVDAMSGDQARGLVADSVPGLPPEQVERLAHLAGRWPVLLNLVNGALRRRVGRGQPVAAAAIEIVARLVADGPTAFDPTRPADRGRAVRATVEASLSLLDPADVERYLDLAVFPEDVEIPLTVLTLLWPGCRVDALAEEWANLGLVADFRLDAPGPRLVLHDVMLAYLRTRRSPAQWSEAHGRLVDAAAGLLPQASPLEWWALPEDPTYVWRYLPWHLLNGGRPDELVALLTDLRWTEAKTARFSSTVAVEADLALIDTPVVAALRTALRKAAPVLDPIDPPTALGATLASRLWGAPSVLQPVLESYRATLPTPRLEPAWPLPDNTHAPRPATEAGHIGAVNRCAFSPDGALLVSTGDDATARLWDVADGTQRHLLTGHTGRVFGCAFSPDSALLATASDDGTVRLWRLDDGTVTVLRGTSGRCSAAHSRPMAGCWQR